MVLFNRVAVAPNLCCRRALLDCARWQGRAIKISSSKMSFQRVDSPELYLAGLAPDTKPWQVAEHLQRHEISVLRCSLVMDYQTRKCKGYGFVRLAGEKDLDILEQKKDVISRADLCQVKTALLDLPGDVVATRKQRLLFKFSHKPEPNTPLEVTTEKAVTFPSVRIHLGVFNPEPPDSDHPVFLSRWPGDLSPHAKFAKLTDAVPSGQCRFAFVGERLQVHLPSIPKVRLSFRFWDIKTAVSVPHGLIFCFACLPQLHEQRKPSEYGQKTSVEGFDPSVSVWQHASLREAVFGWKRATSCSLLPREVLSDYRHYYFELPGDSETTAMKEQVLGHLEQMQFLQWQVVRGVPVVIKPMPSVSAHREQDVCFGRFKALFDQLASHSFAVAFQLECLLAQSVFHKDLLGETFFGLLSSIHPGLAYSALLRLPRLYRQRAFYRQRQGQVCTPFANEGDLQESLRLAESDMMLFNEQRSRVSRPALHWLDGAEDKDNEKVTISRGAAMFPSPFQWEGANSPPASVARRTARKTKRLQWTLGEVDDGDKTYCRVGRVYVTPLGVRCTEAQPELSNRVLRHFWEVRDRFLRVNFTDESLDFLPSEPALIECVQDALCNGIVVCGRKYEALAFSASQLRERSAWFFAPTDEINADAIRDWLGDFRSITNPAKYFARLGQAFSGTFTTDRLTSLSHCFEEIDDVTSADGKYTFSDGVGRISPVLAKEAARSLGLPPGHPTPSAFQIRFGGYKGVVAVYPAIPAGVGLQLRPSMNKFDCQHHQLEVVRSADRLPGYLNRQFILLLSCLGVPDLTFLRLQDKVMKSTSKMTTSKEAALSALHLAGASSSLRPLHIALKMLSAGFSLHSEPFLARLMSSLSNLQRQELRDRAHIPVEKAACLMGVMDETGHLKYGQVFVRVFDAATGDFQTITGQVMIGKNPAYHPGDLRVLEAVDDIALHHLNNVLVFPQNGERPHPDECSGSDLDGDLYFVSWEPDLLPPTIYEPMDYQPPPPRKRSIDKKMSLQDMADFFTEFLKGDSLGKIANAHLALADASKKGALDERCLELALLHSRAVDYPKTGVPAIMTCDLSPSEYPDFMEYHGYKKTYKSKKVLGKLYHAAVAGSSVAVSQGSMAGQPRSMVESQLVQPIGIFDESLEVPGYEAFVPDAQRMYDHYVEQLDKLCRQFGIQTEADLFVAYTPFSMKHTTGQRWRRLSDLQHIVHMELASFLRRFYRFQFLEPGERPDMLDRTQEDKKWMKRRDYYHRKASAWYNVTYHHDHITAGRCTSRKLACLSFPWVAAQQLCDIKESAANKQHQKLFRQWEKFPLDQLQKRS